MSNSSPKKVESLSTPLEQLIVLILAVSTALLSNRLKGCTEMLDKDTDNLRLAAFTFASILLILFVAKVLIPSSSKIAGWAATAASILTLALALVNLVFADKVKIEVCGDDASGYTDKIANKHLLVTIQVLSWIVVLLGAKKVLMQLPNVKGMLSKGKTAAR